jgi:hypothetical protein
VRLTVAAVEKRQKVEEGEPREDVQVDCKASFLSEEKHAKVENEIHTLPDKPPLVLGGVVDDLGRVSIRRRGGRGGCLLVRQVGARRHGDCSFERVPREVCSVMVRAEVIYPRTTAPVSGMNGAIHSYDVEAWLDSVVSCCVHGV